MVNQFLDLILDARKSKPSFSNSLLQLDCVDGAVANLLPFAPASLADTNLISKLSKNLSEGGEDAANICNLFASILEDTLILLEHYRDDEARQWPLKFFHFINSNRCHSERTMYAIVGCFSDTDTYIAIDRKSSGFAYTDRRQCQ